MGVGTGCRVGDLSPAVLMATGPFGLVVYAPLSPWSSSSRWRGPTGSEGRCNRDTKSTLRRSDRRGTDLRRGDLAGKGTP